MHVQPETAIAVVNCVNCSVEVYRMELSTIPTAQS